uniref:Metalloendopeptidase n=1 Tax=Strongyloides stercoralis TaxID=6248 RepID=A0AAF5D3J5_STRER
MILLRLYLTCIIFVNIIKSKNINQKYEKNRIQEQTEIDYKNTMQTIGVLNQIEKKIIQKYKEKNNLIIINTNNQKNKQNDTNNADVIKTSDLYEGDIMLKKFQANYILEKAKEQAEKIGIDVSRIIKLNTDRNKRKITILPQEKWTFPIKYYVDDYVPDDMVDRALKMIEEQTCVKFAKTYSLLFNEPGLVYYYGNNCWSYVGKVSDYDFQPISIGRGCQIIGIIQHETLHALGLNHEHDRTDRDSYVKVNIENVNHNEVSNFMKISPLDTSTYNISYDYGSIMHYDVYAFSKNNRKTMIPIILIYEKTMGQTEKMAFDDVKLVNLHYCSKICTFPLKCYNGGYQDPKNCLTCRCVEGFLGKQCDQIPSKKSECPSTCYNVSPNEVSISINGQKNCIIHLRTNIGDKIKLTIDKSYFDYHKNVCISKNSLEIKYMKDKTTTGARFCGYDTNIPIVSQNHHIVIMYSISITLGMHLESIKIDRDKIIQQKYMPKNQSIYHLFSINNEKFSEIENESYVKTKEEFLDQKKCLSMKLPYRWDTNIDYIVGKEINKEIVHKTLKMIEDETCFKFKRIFKKNLNTQGIIYNISTFHGSFIGKVVKNDYQYIYLRKGSEKKIGLILYATVNTLGMYNEHMRPDRGKHIRVNFENIDKNAIMEFYVLNGSNINSYGIDYDYGSLLHYGNIAYSKDRKPTIEAYIDGYNKMIGHLQKLSFNDYKLLNMHYCANECKTKLLCYNSGYQDPKNCEKCKCPNGYIGNNCEKIVGNDKKCGSLQLINSHKNPRNIIIKGNKSCTYLIKAPNNYVIKLNIKDVLLTKQRFCIEKKGLEIKYRKDKGAMGLNLCDRYKNIYLKSEDNNVLIQYNGYKNIDKAVIRYKHVPEKIY